MFTPVFETILTHLFAFLRKESLPPQTRVKPEFSSWNRSNLHTLGVIETAPTYVCVSHLHPAIVLLKHNEDITGIVLSKNATEYKLSPDLFAHICLTLEARVFLV